jgi:hypothetical protein
MSEADVLKILIASQAGLLGMFIWHLFKCRDTRIDLAMIKGTIDRIASDIGTHESGIRGTVHKTANRVSEHEARLITLERGPR